MRGLLIVGENPTHFPFSNLTGPMAPNRARTLEHNPALIHGGIMTLPGLPGVPSASRIRSRIRLGARGEVEGLFGFRRRTGAA